MSDFEIGEASEGQVAILSPKGSLNTRTSPTLEQRLGALLDAKSRLIVVDMKEVDSVSSSALRALLMTTRRLKRVSGKLLLCGLREEVRKVFAISGFDRDFNIQATRGEAIALAAATELPPLEDTKLRKPEKKAAAQAEPPPEPAPDPVATLALKLLSKGEDAPPWPGWSGGGAPDVWRARVLEALAE